MTRLLWLLVAALAALPAAAQIGPDPADVRPVVPILRVVVISLDGMRPDALLEMPAPNLRALAERGAADWHARTVLPSITMPAHASMLTGLDVSVHGVNDNDSWPACAPIHGLTFITTAAQAGYRAALVAGKEKLCRFQQSDQTNYTFARAGDRSVADRVIELLRDDYAVIFAHFPNPDYFGHLTGWRSAEYDYNVSATDAEVGRILDAIAVLGLTDETLVIVTADHGGEGRRHGRDTPADRTIPWLMAGPSVRSGARLEGVNVADTAATVLWALGLPLPENALGRPRLDAFELAPVAPPTEHSGEGTG